MIGYGDDRDGAVLVESAMRAGRPDILPAVCLQHLHHASVRLRLHAKTGSMMADFSDERLRPFIAMAHALANHAETASRTIARTSSSVSPCVTQPGRAGTSAQYPVSGASHLWIITFKLLMVRIIPYPFPGVCRKV